ncbi:uncharacterized protein LOC118514003 [Anopheles stephensi]|nr:uncharacterized protein LOC118514003 [Anopheles stephensi]XP_035916358.1 uncharacterized protein LOC118514003 [Anopheles stephensi]
MDSKKQDTNNNNLPLPPHEDKKYLFLYKMIADVEVQLTEQNKKLDQLTTKMEQLKQTIMNHPSGIGSPATAISTPAFSTVSPAFSTAETIDDLNSLELKLCNVDMQNSFIQWLKMKINRESNKERACDALNIITGPNLLVNMSWTGKGKAGAKVALCNFIKILQAIQDVSGNCINEELKAWMQLKLHHSDNMLKSKYCNKSSCHERKNKLPKLD